MATGFPPPYPPPPPGFDPRQADPYMRQQYRQQMKAQMRAQKAAFRGQRELYRQQNRAMRRTSILGPLLIIAVGVILLLIHLGRLSYHSFASFYGRWWPLLLVVAGVVLVAEWAFDGFLHQRASTSGVPYGGRRGIGGGVIFLLILLALTGASIDGFSDHVVPAFNNLHVDSDNFGQFFGDRHDFTQQIDQPFAAGSSLTIDNPHGDVTITGVSTDSQIHIVVNKQVYTWGDNDATTRSNQLSPSLSSAGPANAQTLTLTLTVPTLEQGSADLAITLPASAQVTVTAGHGAVTASDLTAPINVTANHGDVELDRIGAGVVARTNSGSSFSAHDIHGNVTLRGHADDLNLTGVTGAVSLEGEFFGDTHLERLAGPVTFHTDRTQFSVAQLDGMVDISNDSEMTGDQLVGPVDLTTRSRNISFERVAGPVSIANTNGTVDITASAPAASISVENTNGEVTLTLPDPATTHAGFSIVTATKDGGIDDELDDSHVEDDPKAMHTATIGNGAAHITLHTTHADITLHKGLVEPPSSVPATPTAPAAPAPPAPPVKLNKHSKTI
jgi:DUF4097 and DUF4098 domain-containing protein YvlB